MTNLNVSPLSAAAPVGFKQPVCQEANCGRRAVWLVRGGQSLAVCEIHLEDAAATLSPEGPS